MGGDWVDEDSKCVPERAGGRACLAAEERLLAHPLAGVSIILRLAGIYGPGRLPNLQALQAGEPIAAPEHGFLNLIHVDDAARAVVAAGVASRAGGRRYLVSDGCPVSRREYYAEVARLSAAPPPRFVAPAEDAHAVARAAAEKRVRNDRLLEELGVQLEYPDFRAGLKAIVDLN
jgi:nucleoside-diphosphate-sugar epimerase